jgi:hypothetical protein
MIALGKKKTLQKKYRGRKKDGTRWGPYYYWA